LRRIDKDADHQIVTPATPFPHQGQMAFMKKSHGRYKSDRLAFTSKPVSAELHFLYGSDDFDNATS